jgi:signal transduction histidine kinase
MQRLRYTQVLGLCSQVLLELATNEDQQAELLGRALEHLREGAGVTRNGLFENYWTSDGELYSRLVAEAAAPGVPRTMGTPGMQAIQWASRSLRDRLEGGQMVAGLMEDLTQIDAALARDNDVASYLFLPIHFGDHWWGYIAYGDGDPARYWDGQEIILLRTAAEMIANVLRRWQAESDLRRASNELEQRVRERTGALARRLEIEQSLATMSGRMLSEVDPDKSLAETLRDTARIMGADRVVLARLDPKPFHALHEVQQWHGTRQTPLSPAQVQSLVDLLFRLDIQLQPGQPVVVGDLSSLAPEVLGDGLAVRQWGINSLVALPLRVEEQLIGVLICTHLLLDGEQGSWEALKVVAGMISSLIHRNMVLESLEKRVATHTRELSTFFDLTMLASEARTLSGVLEPGLVKIMQAVQCQAVCLHLLSEEAPGLQLTAHLGVPGEWQDQLQVVLPTPFLAGWLRQLEQPLFHPVLADAWELPWELRMAGFSSLVSLQLRARGEVLGLLTCYRAARDTFSLDQISLLAALAEQLGTVVANHRLQQQAEEMAVIGERQRLARELHDAVTQSLYSQTLFARTGIFALDENDLDKARDSLLQLEACARETLKEMRLLLYQLGPQALERGNLTEAIGARLELVERRAGVHGILQMPRKLELDSELEAVLYRVIIEALNNALKHSQSSQVQVRLWEAEERVHLVVGDDGIGFAVPQTAPGVGLQSMQERISQVGGMLQIRSTPDKGTEVYASVPIDWISSDLPGSQRP